MSHEETSAIKPPPPELAIYTIDDLAAELSRRSRALFLFIVPPKARGEPVSITTFAADRDCDLFELEDLVMERVESVISAAIKDREGEAPPA